MKSYLFILFLVFQVSVIFSQEKEENLSPTDEKTKSEFWKDVHFGGGIQLSINSAYTVLGVSPSAIYDISDKFSTGIGVSYLFSRQRLHNVNHHVYGGSAIALYNPMKEVQLSTEFEELNVNTTTFSSNTSYWIPAWYIGAAYSMGRHVAIGIRYDLLFDEQKSVYDTAFSPFVRIYF